MLILNNDLLMGYIICKSMKGFIRNMNNNDKWNIGEGGDLPIGFGLSLAANSKAMNKFSQMSDEEKQRAVDGSKTQHSKADMEQYVDRLS